MYLNFFLTVFVSFCFCNDFEKMTIKELKNFFKERNKECIGCFTKEDYITEAQEIKDLPVVSSNEKSSDSSTNNDSADRSYSFVEGINLLQDIFGSKELMGICRKIKEYLENLKTNSSEAYSNLVKEYPKLKNYTEKHFAKIYASLPTNLFSMNNEPTQKEDETKDKGEDETNNKGEEVKIDL